VQGDDWRTHLGRQAAERIDEDTDWQTLATQLDVERYRPEDQYAQSHSAAPFAPTLLAYLWATVEDESLTGIPTRLAAAPDLAASFGFDPDELPSESTFKPSRLVEERFSTLASTVTTAAEEIRTLAAERGAPIGTAIDAPQENDHESAPSERTLQRHLRTQGQQVLEELESVAFPALSLPRPEEAVYDEADLLDLEAIAAIDQLAANGAGHQLGDAKNPTPELDDPFYDDGPSGETLLEAIKELSVDDIADLLNFALRKTYTRAKPRLQELEHDDGSRFGTRASVALDITYVAYYGDRDELDWVQGAPEDKGYNWCHKFATAVIVGDNTHYTVAVCPLGSTEYADTTAYPGSNNSYYVGDVARRLLSTATEYVSIRRVYADREFHAADVIATLESRNLKYVIPAVKNDHVAPICARFDQLKRGYHEERDTPLYVDREFPTWGRVKGERGNSRVYSRLVILPPDEDDDAHEEGSPQPFLTNLDLDDEIALDRRWAKKQIEEYSARAGIETSYSSIKEVAAWTTSKEFAVRWFHFGFAAIVYNFWLLVDFLTQERLGVIETRKKPRITLSRFLRWLERELGTLI
jgi:hypothetical protein